MTGEVIAEHGREVGLCGHDGDNWEKILIDASKRLVVSIAAIDTALQIRRGNHVSFAYDAVPGNTNINDLVSVSGQGVLEWLNFASDIASGRLYVVLDTDYTQCIYPPTPTGRAFHSPLFYAFGSKEDSLFKALVYDSDLDYYSIFLKRPLWFNTSLKVQYQANGVGDIIVCNGGYHLF